MKPMSIYRKRIKFTVIKAIKYPFCDFSNQGDSASQLLYMQQSDSS